jgi:hypothetical protein
MSLLVILENHWGGSRASFSHNDRVKKIRSMFNGHVGEVIHLAPGQAISKEAILIRRPERNE